MNVTWFNQAWLADRLKPGVRMLLSGRLTGSGFRPDAYEILGAETTGARRRDPIRDQPGPPTGLHTTGIVPIHPSGEGLRVQKIREWVWAALRLAPDALEPLPERGARPASAPGRRRCPRRDPFPDLTEAAAPRPPATRLRGALPPPGRAPGAPWRAPAALDAPPHSAPPGDLVGGWLDQLPFEPTADQLGAFDELDADLGSTQADAAAADGRGRLGQDGGRPLRDVAGARGGQAGGADGADRDARGAALRHPRAAACRLGHPDRPADRLDPGRPAPRAARPARDRRAAARRRNPRADRADG